MRAIVVSRLGGPEVLRMEDLPTPPLGPEDVLVQVAAAGVNYRDIYERERPGYSPLGEPPFVAGMEGAGRILEVGSGVSDLSPGDRVAWWQGPGSYAEQLALPAAEAVPIPDSIDDATACAALLQGLTAHALVDSSYEVRPDDWVLVHSGAGGVGTLLTQMVKRRGGKVIATTSTDEKAEVAVRAGADVVLRYEEVPARVLEMTDGGVAAAYDAVGAETFRSSLKAVRPGGTLVGYGFASGNPPEPIPPGALGGRSLYLTWMLLSSHIRTRPELIRRASELFEWIAAREIEITIGGRYPLEQAARAQADLSSRTTIGKLVLEI